MANIIEEELDEFAVLESCDTGSDALFETCYCRTVLIPLQANHFG